MPLPEWVLKHRPDKTEVHHKNGHYYLYAISYKYSSQAGRTKKITGKLLGKITEKEGFIRSQKDMLRDEYKGKVHIAEVGAGELFVAHMEKELGYLKSSFENTKIDWERIAAAAMMRWIYKSPIKMMDFHWQHSYYHTLWKTSLQDKQVSELLRQLGDSRENILQYFGYFPTGGEHLLIDSTTIPSKSELMENVTPGYGRRTGYSPQSNLLFIFSRNLQLPVYHRVLPGNIRDVSSFALSIEESGVSDVTIIADKGFYSNANVTFLRDKGLKYIIPLRRSSSLIDYTPLKSGTRKGMTGFFEFDRRFIWYFDQNIKGERVVLFFDQKLHGEEHDDYLRRIHTHPEEYNTEDFFERESELGTFACVTNLDETAENIYQAYKCRGQIEQVFDAYKNFLDADRTYMQNDKSLFGWTFINFIAIQAYYKLYQSIKKSAKLKKYSVDDILQFGIKKKKARLREQWVNAEYTKKNATILELALPPKS